MTKNKYLSFFLIILITFFASFLGGFVSNAYKEPWYSQIILPSFNPPSWVFAPVWTILYIMMSISAWRVWNKYFETKLIIVYFVHLIFNAMWSVIFFGFHQIFLALVDLSIILIFIIYLVKIYHTRDKLAYYLMLPYLMWSTFAFFLNLSIFIIN